MVELASTTPTNISKFTVGEYIIYNDGVDNHYFITSINATDTKVTV